MNPTLTALIADDDECRVRINGSVGASPIACVYTAELATITESLRRLMHDWDKVFAGVPDLGDQRRLSIESHRGHPQDADHLHVLRRGLQSGGGFEGQ